MGRFGLCSRNGCCRCLFSLAAKNVPFLADDNDENDRNRNDGELVVTASAAAAAGEHIIALLQPPRLLFRIIAADGNIRMDGQSAIDQIRSVLC